MAEQLHKHQLLQRLYTGYAHQRNVLFRLAAGRVDKEEIPGSNIRTFLPWAIQTRLKWRDDYSRNSQFDDWVAAQLSKIDFSIFIGWASISLSSIRAAHRLGKRTILERGSSHIEFQASILQEEYNRVGLKFSIDQRVIEKELQEYEETDFISIPSQFVMKTFLDKGVSATKLILNNYGSSQAFKPSGASTTNRPFRVLYMGTMSVRKGLVYLFEALVNLEAEHEAWFIGPMDPVVKDQFDRYKKSNWKYFGAVSHYELSNYINQCDVGVQPSVEEGLSMVIPQMISCGIPVIASANSGGVDVIDEGKSGFVVPIRSSHAILEKLTQLSTCPEYLARMKSYCRNSDDKRCQGWNEYGDRYSRIITSLL
ncbi:MAG TPA: glycosyltransferase [Cyclobacteriaceae bacterium]|nr:glycosyltransferase [Cyclobacteriaceae bacterium]